MEVGMARATKAAGPDPQEEEEDREDEDEPRDDVVLQGLLTIM
jgi:hypothetical protein